MEVYQLPSLLGIDSARFVHDLKGSQSAGTGFIQSATPHLTFKLDITEALLVPV